MDALDPEGGIWRSLYLCVDLFILLLSLLGAVVCIVYRRLSSWLFLAMAGFLLEVFVGIVRQVGWLLLLHSDFGSGTVLSIYYLVLGLLNLIATALILMGFAMALGDIQRQLSRTRFEVEPRTRLPPPDTSEPFRDRKEGSPDIQQ
jgi:hypothetical protein